ncbi:MAG: GspH/FimT family pseudopilin [Proteobacteria bacterium]|nr:GspH/FimT family pseudopilin [Pseudomonadota bacterium]
MWRVSNPCGTRSHSGNGFTLIEMLVVLTIAAIFATLAVPSFGTFIAGQRVKTASYDVWSMLTLARSEALKRNVNVTVTPASGGWQNGWSVTAGSNTLAQREGFSGLTITGPATGLTFNSTGRLTTTVTPFTLGSSTYTNLAQRCVGLDLSGLPVSSTITSGSC